MLVNALSVPTFKSLFLAVFREECAKLNQDVLVQVYLCFVLVRDF
ncbi:MAG: hypothetical protein ACI9T7_003711 [Oleiphilaceae bacterium]|jgi:hypothetical protein